jgi:hypothetical protein
MMTPQAPKSSARPTSANKGLRVRTSGTEPAPVIAAASPGTTVGEHPQRLELDVVGQHPQALGADRDGCDGMRVMGVGLAVVTGVEQPGPCRELGRHVNHGLAVGQQTLRQRATGTVAALDRPHPVGHRDTVLRIAAYPALSVSNRPVANTVSRSSTTSIVADNLGGSTPMNTFAMPHHPES